MKNFKVLFGFVFLIALAFSSFESKAQSVGDPITQYLLVDASSGYANLRNPDKVALLLRKLGFKVTTYKQPRYADPMDAHKYFSATRVGKGGRKTTVVYRSNDGDSFIDINFASREERDDFVSSLIVSHYVTEDSALWIHPLTAEDVRGKVFVKVGNLNAKLCSPWEMLPSNW